MVCMLSFARFQNFKLSKIKDKLLTYIKRTQKIEKFIFLISNFFRKSSGVGRQFPLMHPCFAQWIILTKHICELWIWRMRENLELLNLLEGKLCSKFRYVTESLSKLSSLGLTFLDFWMKNCDCDDKTTLTLFCKHFCRILFMIFY